MLVPFGKGTETSVIEFCPRNEQLLRTLELRHIEINTSSRERTVQLAKTCAITNILTHLRAF